MVLKKKNQHRCGHPLPDQVFWRLLLVLSSVLSLQLLRLVLSELPLALMQMILFLRAEVEEDPENLSLCQPLAPGHPVLQLFDEPSSRLL